LSILQETCHKVATETVNSLDATITAEAVSSATEEVIKVAKTVGVSGTTLGNLTGIEIKITETGGVSQHMANSVHVDRVQSFRLALDYLDIYADSNLEQVYSANLRAAVGHEIGHRINDQENLASNNVPLEWPHNGEVIERRPERFAEFWARAAIGNDEGDQRIIQRIWAIQVAKVDEVWTALEKYNSSHEDKVDLLAVFRGIEERLYQLSPITQLLTARRILYSGAMVPENYALPYNEEQIKDSLNSAGKTTK
jgi:hypothetical protein